MGNRRPIVHHLGKVDHSHSWKQGQRRTNCARAPLIGVDKQAFKVAARDSGAQVNRESPLVARPPTPRARGGFPCSLRLEAASVR